jgi:plasmid segregation protein ParM
MKWYPYGHDFGNAEMCGVLLPNKNQTVSTSIPTAFCKVDPVQMKNLGVETEDNIIQLAGEETAYGIGLIALTQSVDPWNGRGDPYRYASRYSLRAILSISASLIPDKEYGLIVVGGLPAEIYMKNESLRQEIKKALSGDWGFSTDGGKTTRMCHIQYRATLMEGAGALVAYGDEKQASPQGQGIIDIGGRTTDLYVARGGQPVLDFCKGKPLGVEAATAMMVAAFERKYRFPISPLEARQIMHAYANTKGGGKKKAAAYPPLTIFGNPISPEEIAALVQEAVRSVGEDIVSFVAATWRQSDATSQIGARFSPVICIGGGVYYFFDSLKKRIPHLVQPINPTGANAHGYALAAQRLLAKKAPVETEKTA